VGEQYGLNYTQEDVLTLAREAIQTELDFNHQAGLGPETDKLPSWLYEEPLELPNGPSVFDLPDNLIAQTWND
jgi:aldehyde:ferredoxin oxidoreductase